MQPKETSCWADSCIILRYLADPEREITVPIGVVLSSEAAGSLWFRLPHEGENIAGICLMTASSYLEMAQTQIESWLRSGTLPYTLEPLAPLSPLWWEQVRRLMQWRVRLDPPRPIDCRHPDEEIEALYRSWVRPEAPLQTAEGAESLVECDGETPPAQAASRQRKPSAAKSAVPG